MIKILEKHFSDNFFIRLLQVAGGFVFTFFAARLAIRIALRGELWDAMSKAAGPRFATISHLLMFAAYSILAGLGSTKLD